MKKTAYIGLDVHKNSITISRVIGQSNRSEEFKIPHDPALLRKKLKELGRRYDLRVCYEAGACGYGIYRMLKRGGIDCLVVAPGLIPHDGKRIKTDRRDAAKLAKFLRSGILTPVTVLDEELERARDLIRFRDGQVREFKRSKQKILAFLLRRGIPYPDDVVWSQEFVAALRNMDLGATDDKRMLNRYVTHFSYEQDTIDELETEITELAKTERFREAVQLLCAFRGIATLTAMTILTHVPDFRAFPSPGHLASFAGLVPGEYSSGDRRRSRRITKTGSGLLRKAFILAAQQYNRLDTVGSRIAARRRNLAAPVKALAERADRKCRKKYFMLTARGLHTNKAKTAVARELCGFVWEAMMRYYQGELVRAG